MKDNIEAVHFIYMYILFSYFKSVLVLREVVCDVSCTIVQCTFEFTSVLCWYVDLNIRKQFNSDYPYYNHDSGHIIIYDHTNFCFGKYNYILRIGPST